MRGDKNLRRAGKGAAASKAWAEFTTDGEAADPAVTAAQHVASDGGKDVAGEAVKHAWHTAPWESAKAAFGAKGAAALAAVGGAAAIGLVAVATVAVAGGGGGKGGDDVEISSSGKDGDGRDIGSGGKDGDDDTTTTGDDDAGTSASTGSSTTTSTVPGQTTTTGRSSTPGGEVTTTRPADTTRPTVTTQPPGVTTRPTTTTRPVPPTVRFDYTHNHNCPTDPNRQIDVTFTWASNGASATLTPSGGKSMRVSAAEGKHQACTHPGHVWTLTVVGANGTSTSKTVTPQRPG